MRSKFIIQLKRAALAAILLMGIGCGNRPDPQPDPRLNSIFKEAYQLDMEGRHHEALVRYETILAQRPHYTSTRLNAAMAAYDSSQFDKAAEHFQILHYKEPRDWFIVRKLIQCHERLGNDKKIDELRGKLVHLRRAPEGSPLLKRYKGFTRDFFRVGNMRLIGYEFFEPKHHGRLWYFRLEDAKQRRRAIFLLEATPHFDEDGKRLFCLSEVTTGRLRIWNVGREGRSYEKTREFVLAILKGKKQPLVVRPVPEGLHLWQQMIPDEKDAAKMDVGETTKPAPKKK